MIGLPAWYGKAGLFLTTHFVGTKVNRYMGLHGISLETVAKVAAKNLDSGSIFPRAWRRYPASVGQRHERPGGELPLDPFDVLRTV